MRVRGLQTYLTEQQLLQTTNIDALRGMRVGIDVISWIRGLGSLKDPLADAICGLSPVIYGVLDSQIEKFAEWQITPVFIFPGMESRRHTLFSAPATAQLDRAWAELARGSKKKGYAMFAQATSRRNSDFSWCLFHYLKSRNIETFLAPYFAAAQLANFVAQGCVDAIVGRPSLMLFGVRHVIVSINFKSQNLEWVDLSRLLNTWKITKRQLINACLLAGTEHCLTFPYLNLMQFHSGQANFTFGTAIDFIKEADITSYMMHFPNEQMKNDHIDGYCVCKTLIQHPLILQLDGKLRPMENECRDTTSPPAFLTTTSGIQEGDTRSSQLPHDFHRIVGARLPNKFYVLMAEGLISRALPSALCFGEWVDQWNPTVDTTDIRDLLVELVVYRSKALGLLAAPLHPSFRRPIVYSRSTGGYPQPPNDSVVIARCNVNCSPTLPWYITPRDVAAEMKRQQTSKIGLKFCLAWHLHASKEEVSLVTPPNTQRPEIQADLNTLRCHVIFTLLEALEYFAGSGTATIFGCALVDCAEEFQEDALFALELMKFGVMGGDHFSHPPDRPFYGEVPFFRRKHSANDESCILLLSRMMSLISMNLKQTTFWDASVDFDLVAFHSIVRLLKNTLRQLMQASLCSILLNNFSLLKILPHNFFDPQNPMVPSFLLPRNCMGIIVKQFLEFDPIWDVVEDGGKIQDNGSEEPYSLFERYICHQYPATEDPIRDMMKAFRFWAEMLRIVLNMGDAADNVPIKGQLVEANEYLWSRISAMKFTEHPLWSSECPFLVPP